MRYILILLVLFTSCKKETQEPPLEVFVQSTTFIKNGKVWVNVKTDKPAKSKGYIQQEFTTKWQQSFTSVVATPYLTTDTICETNYPADTVYNSKISYAYIYNAKVRW